MRTWARPDDQNDLTTTYTYYDEEEVTNTGQLKMINYSDSTPDVTIDSYDRVGRLTQVSDAVGTRTFSFDRDLLTLSTEAINTSGDGRGAYCERAVWGQQRGQVYFSKM